MESNFNNKDFEQYIKQNADQYRMFPSDKVWKGVNSALHTRRKWYGFWLGFLLLLTGGAVTWVMTTHPVSTKLNSNTKNALITADPTTPVEFPDIEELLPFNKPSTTTLAAKTEMNIIKLPFLLQEPAKVIDQLQVPQQQYTAFQSEIERPAIVNKINQNIPHTAITEANIAAIKQLSANNKTVSAASA